jgi:8-amino-7-oxononanoate synthase
MAGQAKTLVVVEGIYSMLGDTAPLPALLEVTHRYGAYLLVDEAHSLGVLGERGCGLAEAEGLLSEVDFIVGTFSKSLGAVGGYCVSNLEGFDTFRLTSHAYRYSTALPPSVVASVRASLRIIRAEPHLRQRLWQNVCTLFGALRRGGCRLGPVPSPIVAVSMPTPETAMEVWRALLERGFYVNIGIPPATPNGESLLRCAVCAAHSTEQLEALAAAIITVGREMQILSELRAVP